MPKLGSIYYSIDWGYLRVVTLRDDAAYVVKCTVNGHRIGSQAPVETNLAWFEEWPLYIEDSEWAAAHA